MKCYAFKKGFLRLSTNDKKKFMKAAMRIFKVQSENSFYEYCRGSREPKISQAVALEKLFAKYHVTEIWGKR